MNSATLRLVLLVSCAHALVHVYELALPSVEKEIARDYRSGAASMSDPGEDDAEGKRLTGLLSTTWRLPFGFGALLAGVLVDYFGSRRMLLVYLIGCSAACAAAGMRLPIAALFATMFMMGAFASIYHPAGLTLISTETATESRARALGIHGIFGSAGIATAPFLVGIVLSTGASWRQCYWLLSVPGVALTWLLWRRLGDSGPRGAAAALDRSERGHWPEFGILVVATLLQGFVYAGVLSFLARYLTSSPWASGRLDTGNYLTAFVLALGCIGQYAAGRFARVERLERQLTLVTLANVPLLLVMAYAAGNWRIVAAGAFSVVHFMHQPLYNSLVAQYTPAHRRSVCYGFSFAMSFGLGSFGATLVGFSQADRAYQSLAAVAAVSGLLAMMLWVRKHLSVADNR